MAVKAPFRKCVKCGAKLPPTDGHSLCVLCLGEGHKVEACHHCMAFTKQTRRNRADRLRAILWEKALRATDAAKMDKTASDKTVGSDRSTDVCEETMASSRALIPLTPGRSLTSSAARKITKKARTPKPSSEMEKRKKAKKKDKERSSSTSTRPSKTVQTASSSASVPTATSTVSVPRPASLPILAAATQAPPRPPSLSEGEIRDSVSAASARVSARPIEIEEVIPLPPSPTERAAERNRSPRHEWDRASQYSEACSRRGYYDWEYYQPQRYFQQGQRYQYPPDVYFVQPPPTSRNVQVPLGPPTSRQSSPTSTYRRRGYVSSAPTATATATVPTHQQQLETTQQGELLRHSSPEDSYPSDSESAISITPSVPSPEDAIYVQERASPSEEMGRFSEHMLRMAQSLGLDIQQPEEPANDPIYDVFRTDSNASIAIPLPLALKETAQLSWKTPASSHSTSRRLETLYRIQERDAGFLAQHPPPNSIVVESAQGRSQRAHSAPVDKEGRKLDITGRRIYSSASLGIRAAAYQATMARYQLFLWDKVGSLCDYLPEDKRELARVFHTEASVIAKQQLSTARHQTDCHSKSMMGAVSLRRHAWLRSANLPQETKTRIESMPFDGEGLFNAKTDETLDTIYKARTTAKKMGFTGPTPQYRFRRWARPPAHQQQQRAQYQGQPRQQHQLQRKRPYQGRFQQDKRQPDFSKKQRV